jgi:diguanylate cyclase (GGDEF)-like protein
MTKAQQPIPLRAALLSSGALTVPLINSLYVPEQQHGYEILVWLLPLVPAFLWAYYRGWKGAAVGFAGGMAILTIGQVAALVFGLEPMRMVYLVIVVAVLASVSVGVGIVAELLHRERERAMRLAYTDELTGMPNRRHLELFLDYEFAAARRGRKLVVVIFDLDGFKAFNDRHGHGAGDDVLRAWAGILQGMTRRMHLSARSGGEEFISVLSDSTPDGALVFVQRVMKKLAAQRFRGATVTASAGIAAYDADMESTRDLIDAADGALYRAKADGRNCVRVADDSLVVA